LIREGIHESGPLLQEVEALIRSEPLARIDYAALCDPASLEPIERIEKEAVLLLAVQIGAVRLLDNLLIHI
ncbi:MAG: pantoate--beta-alanine ligase, partial [Candidatus Manganitrophaceae bacterium]